MLIDHLLVAPPAYSTTWLEPITLLAALSGVTRTIQLGTLVLVLPFREPVQFAKQWATLDVLSGGRLDPRRRRRLDGGRVRGASASRTASAARRMNELLELITALWTQEPVTYEGRFYRVARPLARPEAGPAAAPADLDRRRHAAVREDLRPAGADGRAGPAPDREVREDLGPPLLGDGRDGRPRLGRPPAVHGRVRAAARGDVARLLELRPRAAGPASDPRTPRRCSASYSGMDLDYWQRYYLLGEAEEVADRIRAKIEALGGVDHLVLNPLNWDPANLERLANDVLPRVAA